MNRRIDLTIIGGGFAGLACAVAAARRGLRTVVLERKGQCGHRPHTTGLLVKEVADLWDVPRRYVRKIRGVRLYSPALNSVDLVRPGYHFLATDTPGLLRWWSREARQACAEVRFNTPFRRASRGDGVWCVNGDDLETRCLVAADGARSRVARALKLGVNRRFLSGVEAEFIGVRGVDDDRIHVFLDSHLAPGYIAWVVPGLGQTQVGLAARYGRPLQLDRFIERVAGLFDFSGARIVSRRGGLIPVGGPVSPMGCDGAALVGDAAGLVSPLTAGGIHTALESGRLAGLAVCDHLLDGGEQPWRVIRRTAPTFVFKRLLRFAFDLDPPNTLYDLALRSRPLRAAARAVFFHHRGLLSWRAWRDIAQELFAAR